MKIQNIKLKLVRENIGEYDARKAVTSPYEMVTMINNLFDQENDTKESLVALFFDTKNKLIGADVISVGTIDSSLVSPREILQKGFMVNASRIAVAHNHPSGDTTPSEQDIEVTKRLKDACRVMGVDLLDHVIIGYRSYRSLREYGVI